MEQNKKHFILHMDLDSFFVSVERLKNPELIGQPVIIGGKKKRGVVSSCSYEARQYGVHSAMPSVKAHTLCPNGIFLSTNLADYGKYSRMVTQIIAECVPLYEKASIDEFYVDLTGLNKYYNCYSFAKALRNDIIDKTGLPISFGLASNKVIAKMATNMAKPNGHLFVKHEEEHLFLNQQPIENIPGLGTRSVNFLHSRNIQTIKELREAGKNKLVEWFGKHGEHFWHKANGKGSSIIINERERKSISKETTFFSDENDEEKLISVLHGMAEELSHRLRMEDKKTTTLSIKFRQPDFTTTIKQKTITATNYEHELIPEINQFFNALYKKQPLRLIGLKLAGLTNVGHQTNLFYNEEKQVKIYKSIDELKLKYGKKTLYRGSSS